jgi:hypothetical protein
MRFRLSVCALLASSFLYLSGPVTAAENRLSITPVGSSELASLGSADSISISPQPQQRPEWCWAASATMVLSYFNYPSLNPADYQCGVVAFAFQSVPGCLVNCALCPFAGGQFSNIALVVSQYPQFASLILHTPQPALYSTLSGPIAFASLVDSIDSGDPIIAGISPASYPGIGGEPHHAVVIIGYDDTVSPNTITVNDPWPTYGTIGQPDPYLALGAQMNQPGQYTISYNAFLTQMYWTRALHHIHQ